MNYQFYAYYNNSWNLINVLNAKLSFGEGQNQSISFDIIKTNIVPERLKIVVGTSSFVVDVESVKENADSVTIEGHFFDKTLPYAQVDPASYQQTTISGLLSAIANTNNFTISGAPNSGIAPAAIAAGNVLSTIASLINDCAAQKIIHLSNDINDIIYCQSVFTGGLSVPALSWTENTSRARYDSCIYTQTAPIYRKEYAVNAPKMRDPGDYTENIPPQMTQDSENYIIGEKPTVRVKLVEAALNPAQYDNDLWPIIGDYNRTQFPIPDYYYEVRPSFGRCTYYVHNNFPSIEEDSTETHTIQDYGAVEFAGKKVYFSPETRRNNWQSISTITKNVQIPIKDYSFMNGKTYERASPGGVVPGLEADLAAVTTRDASVQIAAGNVNPNQISGGQWHSSGYGRMPENHRFIFDTYVGKFDDYGYPVAIDTLYFDDSNLIAANPQNFPYLLQYRPVIYDSSEYPYYFADIPTLNPYFDAQDQDPDSAFMGPYICAGYSTTATPAREKCKWGNLPEFIGGQTIDELQLINSTFFANIIQIGMYGTQIFDLSGTSSTVSLPASSVPAQVIATEPQRDSWTTGTANARPLTISNSILTSKVDDLFVQKALFNANKGAKMTNFSVPLVVFSSFADILRAEYNGKIPVSATINFGTDTVDFTISEA